MEYMMRLGLWIVRALIFILILVLVYNNRESVTFSLFTLTEWKLPLIVLCFIFLILGMIIGLVYSFFNNVELKAKIKLLQADLDKERKSNPSNT